MANNLPKFRTIDGNYGSCSKCIGYCVYHQGCLTTRLCYLHGCVGKQCQKLILFDVKQVYDRGIAQYEGDEYRKRLKHGND